MRWWLGSHFTGCQQRVILNGSKPSWKNVISGVPQGSVLGPLLLIIYVNAIDDRIASRVLKFADDIKVFRVIKRREESTCSQVSKVVRTQRGGNWNLTSPNVRGKRQYEMKGHKLGEISKEKDLGFYNSDKPQTFGKG